MSKKKAHRIRPLGRRHGRRLGNGLELSVFEGPRLGPGMETASPADVLAALERLDPDLPWPAFRDQVIPMLPRVRPYPGPELDPVRVVLPPGILVGFGIDLGPALTIVSEALLGAWKLDAAALASTALENLRIRAEACDATRVHRDRIGDTPVGILQSGLGIGAALLLVPEHIDRLLGGGPHLLVAPMRDLLIALPDDVDPGFAAWLAEEFEVLDPNHLHLGGFRHRSGVVTPVAIEDALAEA